MSDIVPGATDSFRPDQASSGTDPL